ncbi:helix-turn-helix domain-containing protein [Mesobacillus boroniphilus]
MLTTEKISEIFKIHPETVRGWIRDGKLKSY